VSYTVFIQPRAERELAALPRPEFLRVDSCILSLKENPRPAGCKKLKGREGWRIRVGSYRIIYDVDDTQRTVLIRDVLHRKDVYR